MGLIVHKTAAGRQPSCVAVVTMTASNATSGGEEWRVPVAPLRGGRNVRDTLDADRSASFFVFERQVRRGLGDVVYQMKVELNNNVVLIAFVAVVVSYIVGTVVLVVQRWRGCRVSDWSDSALRTHP